MTALPSTRALQTPRRGYWDAVCERSGRQTRLDKDSGAGNVLCSCAFMPTSRAVRAAAGARARDMRQKRCNASVLVRRRLLGSVQLHGCGSGGQMTEQFSRLEGAASCICSARMSETLTAASQFLRLPRNNVPLPEPRKRASTSAAGRRGALRTRGRNSGGHR